MEYSSQVDGNTGVFSFRGKFSFADNDQARNIISEIKGGSYSICAIDLEGLESIDSAGLGMLLLINDSSDEMGKSMELRGASGQVQKMLEISKFGEVLTIR